MSRPRSIFDKLWDDHVVTTRADGTALLYIDRHLLHEGSRFAFDILAAGGRRVRRPEVSFACADHFVPTTGQAAGVDAIERLDARAIVRAQVDNAARSGIALFGLDDPRQGIVHVVGPELGLTLPGLTLVCGDSHTSTHGALGALAFGIGSTEVAHVLATQTLWQRRPQTTRLTIDGRLGDGVTSKDLILAVIARVGAAGASGHVVEYAGEAVTSMTMEARMTMCNMSIEAGARAGLVAPDEATFAYLEGRPYAPAGPLWERAVDAWRALASDAGAGYDRELGFDAGEVAPMVTWGTSPEDAAAITGRVPDPAGESDPARRARAQRALDYMALAPGTPLAEIAIDRVFIGSCTNGRLEDLRAAARVLDGARVAVPVLVVPGSRAVQRAAEAEGLDRVFRAAGAEWRDPGCSMCLGMNGDTLAPGERCASTSNRNFEGRQGKGGRTHLMGPAMAAAAAIAGRLTDVREL